MNMNEYAGTVGRIRFFWRFRCVKLRMLIEAVGLVSMFASGVVLNYLTIIQWYDADHILWLNWNRYGEAFGEYIWAILALPCVLYTFAVNGMRLADRRQEKKIRLKPSKYGTE